MLVLRAIQTALCSLALSMWQGCQCQSGEVSSGIVKLLPSSTLTARRQALVGSWYYMMCTDDRTERRSIKRLLDDGTFSVVFKIRDRFGYVTEQEEFGIWGLHGNLLVAVTRGLKADNQSVKTSLADPYFWDVYEIIELSSERVRYRTIETGNEYRARRVADDFFIDSHNTLEPPGTDPGMIRRHR